jgi:hypothetical protein
MMKFLNNDIKQMEHILFSKNLTFNFKTKEFYKTRIFSSWSIGARTIALALASA